MRNRTRVLSPNFSTKGLARIRAARVDLASIAVVAGAFLISVLTVIAKRVPLGHDESVYMLRARDLGELGWSATSGDYWVDYRAPGGSIMLSALGELVGLHVATSRAFVALLATSMVILTWAIGRRLADPRVGLVGAALLALTTGYVSASSLVLADVPGAAFSLAAVWLYAVEVQNRRLRFSFVAIPALTLFACVSRFGAPFMLAAGFVGVSLFALPDVLRERNRRLAVQALLLGLVVTIVCWVVLFTEFVSIRGESPVEANQRLVSSKQLSISTGFRDLWSVVNPWSGARVQHLWSKPVAVIMALGVVAAIVGAILNRVPRRFVVGMAAAAIFSTIGITASIGLIVSNYLVLCLPFWVLLAGSGLAWLGDLLVRPIRLARVAPVFATLVVVVAAGLLVSTASEARLIATRSTASFVPIRAASVELGETFGRRCVAVTSYTPQVGYYSGCKVTVFGTVVQVAEVVTQSLPEMLSDRLLSFDQLVRQGYQPVVFLVNRGKRQPPEEAFQSTAVDAERLFEYSIGRGSRQTSWVQLIDPCVIERNC